METPCLDIFGAKERTEAAARVTPETVASVFNSCNIYPKSIIATISPQITSFDVDFENVGDIPKAKTSRVKTIMEAAFHSAVTYESSPTCHLRLKISNLRRKTVYLEECIEKIKNPSNRQIKAFIGIDTNNRPIALDITAAPHVLIAGTTGCGKSTLLNSILCSLLINYSPNELQLLLLDPKQVELSAYSGVRHLVLEPVTDHFVFYLRQAWQKMEERYTTMAAQGVKDAIQTTYPQVVIVIDELADIMLSAAGAICENYLVKIAQKGRAAGFHLIIATQNPISKVVTSLLKANLPCVIGMKTNDQTKSNVILGHKGAEALTGKGDAFLKLPSQVEEIRFQSAYTSNTDIRSITDFWRK
jgi:S-DNA-T family DNA segregation ATPase FtsK/SpoIIIE